MFYIKGARESYLANVKIVKYEVQVFSGITSLVGMSQIAIITIIKR